MFVVFGSPNPSLLVSLKNPWDLFRDIETSKRRPLTSAFDIFFLCDEQISLTLLTESFIACHHWENLQVKI